jgi:hypothetical protein
MTDRQSDFLKMLKVLFALFTSFSIVVESIPAFKRAVEKLGTLITDIVDADTGRPIIKSGKSKIKTALKKKFGKAVYNLANSLATYADEHNKPEIASLVEHPETYYTKMRDINLPLEANRLIQLTKGIEAELLDHGVTAEEITTLINLSREFNESMTNLRKSVAKGSSATKSVYQLIGEANSLLSNRFKRHMKRLKESNPDFYTQYTSACKVIEHSSTHEKKTVKKTTAAQAPDKTT